MMKRTTTILGGLCLALVLLSGCRKDPPTPEVIGSVLKLTVRPVWNGFPFDKTRIHLTPAAERVRITLVKFYLADFTLVSGGKDRRLFDADLFDVTNGPLTRVFSAPTGDQQELRFGLGLPPVLNHRDISTIPPNDPTGNNSGMYWDWASMYRFVLFSGHFDNDANATGEPPYNFDIHTGHDTCYRTRSIPIDLHLDADDTMRLTLNVDIARFFTNGTDTLDLSQFAIWHGEADNLENGLKVATLESDAFSVQ
jgi:hypothetical protein